MLRAGFGHFLAIAAAGQWDEAELHVAADAPAWATLGEWRRERIERLVASFCVAEAEVASQLELFAAAAGDAELAACFSAQVRDEQRHARFFELVARELIGVSRIERGEWFAAHTSAAFRALLEERLPRAARRIAGGEAALEGPIALCHLLLEGVVFTSGLYALGDELGERMPNTRRGVELVLRDERWHLGLGVSVLAALGPSPEFADALTREAAVVAKAWAGAVPEPTIAQVLELHRRRLAVACGAQVRSSSSSPPCTPFATATP
jgi:ribonucleoside-diphosphate reductase beta chain